MRNLKKFLALALAVMMTFSLMVTANAITTNAAVTDQDSITDEFKEAVAVLNGLGIITGYEDGTFRPDKPITRQETTALVYRLHSGDVKDTKNDLYSTADNIKQFTDVKADGGQKWSAGYIGYCANQGIIKGVSDTRFAPTHEVTGYQVLAMVLRAIGYGQNKEYEGSGWQTRVASSATNLGLLKNVTNTNYSATLSAPATRELVAEIIFQAALQDTVTYTAGLGYVKTGSGLAGGTNGSLSKKNFDLKSGDYQVIDDWGRPGYKWYSGSTAIATITATPAKEYDTTQRECDVAHDLGIETYATYRLFVNSAKATTDSYRIEATDTVTKVGGQGRITEFYAKLTNPHNGSTWPASVVMIDTYLAKVTGVTAPVLDKAGHVIVPAKLNLDVYDGPMSYGSVTTGIGTNNPLDSTKPTEDGKFPSKHVATQNTAFEYVVGDMLLVRGYTDYTQYWDNEGNKGDYDAKVAANATKKNETGLNHTISAEALEKTAFETNVLKADDDEAKISIVGKADMKLGKQTKTYYNDNKHNVDSNDYNDQLTLFLDRAKTDTKVTWAWYFDAKGNLIGIDEAPTTTQYGVITSLYAAFNQGESHTDGTSKAIATVLMADGTTQTIEIDRFLMTSEDAKAGRLNFTAANTPARKRVDVDTPMTTATTTGVNIELIPQYDYNGGTTLMTADQVTSGVAHNALQKANLFVAPITSLNNQAENELSAWTPKAHNSHYGIIRGNMFKFVNTSYGMTAVEVAGAYDDSHNDENTGIYEWLYNDLAVDGDSPKLAKTLGLLKVNASKTITVGNNTKIIVKSSDNDNVINVYNGLSALPGDVTIAPDSEVDWVDFNGDGRVDYVYLTGRATGTITYGLFYYNGGAAIWDGTTGTGTLTGWLNGEATTVTFNDQAMFNIVKDHTSNIEAKDYKAHLFALQIMNGVVSNVMYSQDSNKGPYLLATDPKEQATGDIHNTYFAALTLSATSADDTALIKTNVAAGATAENFGLGGEDSKWGNPYDQYTGLAYHKDVHDSAANTNTNVVYNPGNSTVTFNDAYSAGVAAPAKIYHITDNTKIIGLGRGITYGENVLYYLNECDNDVTIVYDKSDGTNMVALEIYVATDPDWTPGGSDNTAASGVGADVNRITAPTTQLVDIEIKSKAPGVNKEGSAYTSSVGGSALGDSNADDVLYIPFTQETAGKSVTLEVYPVGSSTPVYTETSAAINDTNAHYFVFNYKVTALNAGTLTNPLSAGKYIYYVIDANGALLTNGSFTLV